MSNDDIDHEVQAADEERVQQAIALLQPYFDTVQIFVTRLEPEGCSLGFSTGVGNWYARYGVVTEWLENGGAMHIAGDDDE